MRIERLLFVGSCVAAFAVACGGSSTSEPADDAGGGLDSSGGSSSGSSSGSTSGSSSGGLDATTPPGQTCASAQDCTNPGDVCCISFGMGGGMGGGATSACAASCMGVQLCTSSTECPAGDQCAGFGGMMGAMMFCRPQRGDAGVRTGRDGGAPRRDGGGPMDDAGGASDTGAE